MKILIISDAWHPQVNGVVRTYEHLIQELEKQGHTVKIIGPSDFPYRLPCPFYNEIELTPFPTSRLRRKMDEFAPDHIHIAVEGPLGWAARKICVQRKIPFTTCYHTHFPDYLSIRLPRFLGFLRGPLSALSFYILGTFHNASAAVFIVSDNLARQLQSNGFKSPMKIMTRGVNTNIFHTGDKTVFENLPRPIALYVGRVAKEKNIESFLKAKWAGSKVVVGDGPAREELEKKYPQAYFRGIKKGKDLADCYRSADLFVFPSKTDTFGMVNIEALACGLPIAAYPVNGPQDIVTAPELGHLDNNLEKAMEIAISQKTSPEFRLNHVKKMYSWEKATEEFLSGFKNYG